MKRIKEVLLIGLVVFGGVYLSASSSLGQKDYENELRDRKTKVEEYLGKSDGVEREFLEKILNHEDENPSVTLREITNDDTGETFEKIQAVDKENNIDIDGRLDGTIFFRKGNERFWIDTKRETYYTDTFDYSKNHNDDGIISRNESMIYDKFLSGYDKEVEKIGDTYKVTSLDDLNKGSYDIYDIEGNWLESFTDNSQGRWKDKLVSKTTDVNETYEKLLNLKDTYTKVDDLGQIKDKGKK
ncbi:hypothetical protein [uncultured Anaerococcus sp.]|uniref:hypothetical protein n=1 Tax=uncultured Anaerococcus sp. TaxID=293428 RepID=UPI0028896D24|nr:hypothetical protein [uncultured Anaerococcus sp.]